MTAEEQHAEPSSAAAGASLTGLSQQVVVDLARRWEHAEAFLLIDGRLRCTAASGPFPVADGRAPGTDPVGRAATSGRTVVDAPDPAATDVDETADAEGAENTEDTASVAPSRVCAPVLVDGSCAGVVGLAGRSRLPAEAVADAEAAAGVLAQALSRPGAPPTAPVGQRLSRVSADVAGAADAERLVRIVIEGATTLSGRSSAALLGRSPGGRWEVGSATGPLAQAISQWRPDELAALTAHVPVPASAHLPCGPDGPTGLGLLGRSGLACASAYPLVVGGTPIGLLLVADAEGRAPDPVSSAALEVLAALAGGALRSATLLADLAERAREALTGVRTAEDFRDDLTEVCIDAIRSGEVTHTCMRLGLDAPIPPDGATTDGTTTADDSVLSALVEALTGQLRHGDRLYRLDGSQFAILLATGEQGSAAAVAARLARAADDAGAPVVLGWALVDGPPAVVGAATDRALDEATPA